MFHPFVCETTVEAPQADVLSAIDAVPLTSGLLKVSADTFKFELPNPQTRTKVLGNIHVESDQSGRTNVRITGVVGSGGEEGKVGGLASRAFTASIACYMRSWLRRVKKEAERGIVDPGLAA